MATVTVKLNGPKDVDETMLRMAHLRLMISDAETKMNAKITALKDEVTQLVQPMKNEFIVLEDAVRAYGDSIYSEGIPAMTVPYNFGFIKFTKALGRLVFTKDEDSAIKKIEKAGRKFKALIRVKKSVIKDDAKKLDPKTLRSLGMAIEGEGDVTSHVEIDFEKVAAAAVNEANAKTA